ncbi:MAG: hypothetical protein MUD12_16800 [Spirochaetes bacterium]|jgi:hypothetical protein|nr:hypothetical protein [Spirochaetota bacterium]
MGKDAKLMEKIRLYIEGGLDTAGKEEVENLLRESREMFDFYIELKEALFLKGKGAPAPAGLEERIIGLATGRGAPHCSLIVRFLGDRVSVSSGGSEELKFYGAQAVFSSGTGSVPGPVTIERRIADRELTLVITPPEGDGGCGISATIADGEKLEAVLAVDGREIETLPETAETKIFKTRLPENSEIGLAFKKNNALLFTIGIKIRNS